MNLRYPVIILALLLSAAVFAAPAYAEDPQGDNNPWNNDPCSIRAGAEYDRAVDEWALDVDGLTAAERAERWNTVSEWKMLYGTGGRYGSGTPQYDLCSLSELLIADNISEFIILWAFENEPGLGDPTLTTTCAVTDQPELHLVVNYAPVDLPVVICSNNTNALIGIAGGDIETFGEIFERFTGREFNADYERITFKRFVDATPRTCENTALYATVACGHLPQEFFGWRAGVETGEASVEGETIADTAPSFAPPSAGSGGLLGGAEDAWAVAALLGATVLLGGALGASGALLRRML